MTLNNRLAIIILCFFAIGSAHAQTSSKPVVNGQRLMQHLQGLAEFGKNPQGGVSRVAYSNADKQGREYVLQLMRDAGLEVSIDAAGNLVGTRAGSDPSAKPLLIGSHIDTVPEGGNYDGIVGSLSAIEAAQRVKESGIKLRHPLQVIIFQNEEDGHIGSHAVGEGLNEQMLNKTSQSGKTVRDGISFIGGDLNKLAAVQRPAGSIAGYIELHIEQGSILEQGKIAIGVVTGIVSTLRTDVTIEGIANHAGATPMNQRHDTLLSAARFIEKVNQVVTSLPGWQVGTVGWIKADPGAYNVIPGKTVLGLELRDLSQDKVAEMYARLQKEANQIGSLNQTTFSFKEPLQTVPKLADKSFQDLIDASAKELGLTTTPIPSGGGQDAQEIANIGPMGMIFIPSVGGISHSPKEFSRPQDVENGANVLLRAVIKFDEAH
jgi:beta-ureidopropionase / N-carbamoyl-L-amino-acid hydrolase